MIYYVDGSAHAEFGNHIAVSDNSGNILFFKKINKRKKDQLTNNETEYVAIIEGMRMAESGYTIFSDSKICVEQIKGNFAVNEPRLIPYQKKASELYIEKKINLIWIKREVNLAGHYLEKFIKNNARKRNSKSKTVRKDNSEQV